MTYQATTTLAAIRNEEPCQDGWKKLLAHLGKTKADNEPLELLTVLESNGLDDALWVLSWAMPDDRLARHYQAWCAEQVLHIFDAERPRDTRVRDQIAMLRDDTATLEQRGAARAAAQDAVNSAASAVYLVSDRSRSRALAALAASYAAAAAAWPLVGDASGAAAGAADCSAKAASAADWAAAGDAVYASQEAQLRKMLARAAIAAMQSYPEAKGD